MSSPLQTASNWETHATLKFLNIKWSHSCWVSISLFIVHFGAFCVPHRFLSPNVCVNLLFQVFLLQEWGGETLCLENRSCQLTYLVLLIVVHSAVMWSRLWVYFLLVLISLYDKGEQKTCWSSSRHLWLLNQAVDISLTWIVSADIPWGNISVKSDRVPERCHSTFGQHHVTWSGPAASVRRADISTPLRYRQGLTWETGTDGLLFRLLLEPWMAALILLMDTW